MKFSIITVCYNSAATIEDTVKSVISQNYPNFEYIIIDGGSTDGTMGIIKKYQNKISKIISERDQGVYDAMNKGLKAASGDIVGIINSDDFYFDANVLSEVSHAFGESKADACYGDLKYVDRKNINKGVRYWRAGDFKESKLKSGWIPPHPTFFAKKEIYDKYGPFRSDLKIAADYELMLRFLLKNIKIKYIKKPLALMREGGESAKSLSQRVKGWRELREAWKLNGKRVPPLFICRRVISKISQYFV